MVAAAKPLFSKGEARWSAARRARRTQRVQNRMHACPAVRSTPSGHTARLLVTWCHPELTPAMHAEEPCEHFLLRSMEIVPDGIACKMAWLQ